MSIALKMRPTVTQKWAIEIRWPYLCIYDDAKVWNNADTY